MRCGFCGAVREAGDVCCLRHAANQGRIHADCDHPPPAGISDEFDAAYRAAQKQEVEQSGGAQPARAKVARAQPGGVMYRIQFSIYPTREAAMADGWEDAEFGYWQVAAGSTKIVEGWIALTSDKDFS